jgi:hypothetical protein
MVVSQDQGIMIFHLVTPICHLAAMMTSRQLEDTLMILLPDMVMVPVEATVTVTVLHPEIDMMMVADHVALLVQWNAPQTDP